MGEQPSGTVTFLFTDIEGSTRLWEQHGDVMAGALARHDEILGDAIEANDGHVFATGGDGFAVAFGRAGDALAAATAAQAALTAEAWVGPEIRVRMGLHVGEAEERDGNYFGPALNRAARVMAAGHGGQILATPAVAEVIGTDDLVDLGECRLRDLSGPQRVYQVGDTSFPALRTIDVFPSNLPRSLSTFVGRAPQIDQVIDDLTTGGLVTLTGTGGVGKTRLAVQACAEALPKFADGAWFVDLASIRDEDELPGAVAAVLGVKDRAEEPLVITLRDSLRDREAILLLDNGEHVLEGLARLIIDLTSREVATKFLVTSREPLGLDGEQVRRVVSLDGRESSDLFVQRATTVRDDVDWALHSDEIAEICDRLDGIPLAIELAAARSRSMLPGDILSRLDERFRLLSGGRRTARERHQTLQAAVEWSYDLLEEDERRLFARLAVFRGGFSLEAAEAVASGGGIDEMDVVDLLDRLVDKSMVTALHLYDRSRYRLLETLRQFGESRLVESGDGDEYRERHLDHFRAFVAEWNPLIRSIDQARALAELAEEINNINTALERLVDEERWQEFRMLCGAMLGYWNSRGDNDGVRWFSILVDHADALEPTERAHALAEASYNTAVQGMVLQSGELARRAVEAAADAGCEPSGLAYFALSLAALVDGDLERAFDHATEGERLGTAEGDLVVRLASASMRVTNAVWLRHPEADALLERMEAEAGAFGIPTFVSSIRMAEGVHAMTQGDHELAETKFVEAIDVARGTVPHIVIVSALQRAVSRYQRGEPGVVEAVREALEVFAKQPVMPDLAADIWAVIAANWIREGRVEDAAVLACAAGALLTSLGVRGRAETADIRQQLGDDLAARIDPGELDALIESTGEMTADDVRRFIFERID